MNKEQLFRKLHKSHIEREEYADKVPSDLGQFFTNCYVNSIWQDYDLLSRAAFGEHYDSVCWFLYDWKPGYEVGYGDVVVKIESIDQYIEWMKANEGFE
jgi:hypothetical protein